MAKILRIGAVALLSTFAMLLGVAPAQAAAPSLSINDVTVNEPNWPDWEAPAVFTVSLDRKAPRPVTVQWATSVPANRNQPEFRRASGTVTIPAGQSQGTLTVTVLREWSRTSDRQFTVTLSAPTNATIADGVGVGTIVNSDRAGRFTCQARAGWATAVVGSNTGFAIPLGAGYGDECNYPDEASYPLVSQSVGDVTFTVRAFDLSVAPTYDSWDTRAYVGGGADADAKTGRITITAPDLDIRIETARSHARVRCETLGAPPVMSPSGAVTGVTINGTTTEEITDHQVFDLGGVRLEFNRPTVKTDPGDTPFTRLTVDAVVVTVPVNNVTLILGSSQVGYLHDPCST
jgi:hypothetical protein